MSTLFTGIAVISGMLIGTLIVSGVKAMISYIRRAVIPKITCNRVVGTLLLSWIFVSLSLTIVNDVADLGLEDTTYYKILAYEGGECDGRYGC